MVISVICISDVRMVFIILPCGWSGGEITVFNAKGREERTHHPDLKADVALAYIFGKLFKCSQKYSCITYRDV